MGTNNLKANNMKLINIIGLVILIGCGAGEKGPNIRIMPGEERCGDMCEKFVELDCTGYYEDIEVDCSNKAYKSMEECDSGVGKANIGCVSFCEYEMENSVQLNPGCLADNLTKCSDIEEICN